MSGLPPELVKKLLDESQSRKRGKKVIDTRVRDYPTWFKLNPVCWADFEMQVPLKCDNPDCIDDRPPRKTSTGKEIKLQHVVEVYGVKMCRRCFMGGFLLGDPAQEQLSVS